MFALYTYGMEKQNITLSIPEEVLRKIKILAAQRKISVSQLLTEALERLIQDETGYAEARQRQMEWLEHGFNLSWDNNKPSSRDELHE
jgi:metal-responsive CopG/Arc/MetJ family transcriptional regulator